MSLSYLTAHADDPLERDFLKMKFCMRQSDFRVHAVHFLCILYEFLLLLLFLCVCLSSLKGTVALKMCFA